jgi:hypothetical protein
MTSLCPAQHRPRLSSVPRATPCSRRCRLRAAHAVPGHAARHARAARGSGGAAALRRRPAAPTAYSAALPLGCEPFSIDSPALCSPMQQSPRDAAWKQRLGLPLSTTPESHTCPPPACCLRRATARQCWSCALRVTPVGGEGGKGWGRPADDGCSVIRRGQGHTRGHGGTESNLHPAGCAGAPPPQSPVSWLCRWLRPPLLSCQPSLPARPPSPCHARRGQAARHAVDGALPPRALRLPGHAAGGLRWALREHGRVSEGA